MKPAAKKAASSYVLKIFNTSERRACRLLRLSRSTRRYESIRPDDPKLRTRLKELAAIRRRFGYRQIHRLLKREGFKVNHKKVRRLYREEGLSLRTRKRSKLRTLLRSPLPLPTGINQRWSMDFMSDQLGTTGRRFRILNIVDDFSREALACQVDFSIPGLSVVRVLELLKLFGRKPQSIVIDNVTCPP